MMDKTAKAEMTQLKNQIRRIKIAINQADKPRPSCIVRLNTEASEIVLHIAAKTGLSTGNIVSQIVAQSEENIDIEGE